MTDIQREIEALRSKAALCTPPRSIVEAAEHAALVRQICALQDQAHLMRPRPALAFVDRSYSRGRKRRNGRRSASIEKARY